MICRFGNWQAKCDIGSVYQDDVGYVQNHAQLDAALLPSRDLNYGGDE
jgi:hypothetical protein